MADDSDIFHLSARILNLLRKPSTRSEGMTIGEIGADLRRNVDRLEFRDSGLERRLLDLERAEFVERTDQVRWRLSSTLRPIERSEGPPSDFSPLPPDDGDGDGGGFGDVLAHPYLFVVPEDEFTAAIARALGEEL